MSDSLQPLWTVAHQVPLSMEPSSQEYWSGLSCPSPGDLPDPGIEPAFPVSPALAWGFFTISATSEAPEMRIGSSSVRWTLLTRDTWEQDSNNKEKIMQSLHIFLKWKHYCSFFPHSYSFGY